MNADSILNAAKRLHSIADIGLLYNTNPYDRDRYTEIRAIAFDLLHNITGHSIETLENSFLLSDDYPTAKVDVRGLALSSDKKILMVQESVDGKWTLPGGWADIGYTPSETAIKEVKEETGLDVEVKRLLAVFDKRQHNHPPQPHYVYKLVFHCEALSTEFAKGFDVLDVGWFAPDALPPLSEDRILKNQIGIVYRKVIEDDRNCYFD